MPNHLISLNIITFLLFGIVFILILQRTKPENQPTYLGPWHWSPLIGLSASILFLAQVLFLGITTWIILENEPKVIYPFIVKSAALFWAICSSASLLLFLKHLFHWRKIPELTNEPVPDSIRAVVEEAQDLVRTSHKISNIGLSLSWGRGIKPLIEVCKLGRNQLIVVLRKGVGKSWWKNPESEDLRTAFHRFIIFHELGHHLNNDLGTTDAALGIIQAFRFYWLVSLFAVPTTVIGVVFLPNSTAAILFVLAVFAAGVSVLYVGVVFLYRRYRGERELQADLRAYYSLTGSDSRLLFDDPNKLRSLLFSLKSHELVESSEHKLSSNFFQSISRIGANYVSPINVETRIKNIQDHSNTPSLEEPVHIHTLFGLFLAVFSSGMIFSISFLNKYAVTDSNIIFESITNSVLFSSIILLGIRYSSSVSCIRFYFTSSKIKTYSTIYSKYAIIIFTTIMFSLVLLYLPVFYSNLLEADTRESALNLVNSLAILGGSIFIGLFFGDLHVAASALRERSLTYGIPSNANILGIFGFLAAMTLIFIISIYTIHIFVPSIAFDQSFILATKIAGVPYIAFMIICLYSPVKIMEWLPIDFRPTNHSECSFRILWWKICIDVIDINISKCIICVTLILLQYIVIGIIYITIIISILSIYNIEKYLLIDTIGNINTIVYALFLIIALTHYHRSMNIFSPYNLEIIERLQSKFFRNISEEREQLSGIYEAMTTELRRNHAWQDLLPTLDNPERILEIASVCRILNNVGRLHLNNPKRDKLKQSLAVLSVDEFGVIRSASGKANLKLTCNLISMDSILRILDGEARQFIIDTVIDLSKEQCAMLENAIGNRRATIIQELFLVVLLCEDEGLIDEEFRFLDAILISLESVGIDYCGLSPAQIAQCLQITDSPRPAIERQLLEVLQATMWTLVHVNTNVSMSVVIDCIEAVERLELPVDLFPIALRNILNSNVNEILAHDIHNWKQASNL